MQQHRRRTALVLAVALAFTAQSGCGDDDDGGTPDTPQALRESIPEHDSEPAPQADTTYVGRVEGSEALIAVVANELAAAAYLCDGDQVSEWFLGTPNGPSLQLQGEKGGSVDAELIAGGVEGDVSHDDASHPFSAEVATEGENGIYRSVETEDGVQISTGWIFYDGELRGAGEDTGKNVVTGTSLSGIDDATGSGTGVGIPGPLPQFDCNQGWCEYENLRCFEIGLKEELESLKGKKRKMALRMLSQNASKLIELFVQLDQSECIDNGSACDTGFNETGDTPCCDAAGCD
jgi:hypothetical protein